MRFLLVTLLLVCSFFGYSQSILGTWKTIDDETGKPKSIVEITERDGKAYGKIIKLFREPGEDPDPICDECDEEDPRFNQKVIGMEIIKDMKAGKKGEVYEYGTILDPANGNVYDCELWVEDGQLRVRGYILFLYRTQTWLPYEG